MTTSYNEMLELVRRDISIIEPKVTKLKRLLQPHEAELEKLRGLEAYLSEKIASTKSVEQESLQSPAIQAPTGLQSELNLPATSRTTGTLSISNPTPANVIIGTTLHQVENITPEQILGATKSLLHSLGLGASVRANDIAKKLVPNYNHEHDSRNFENRIFSLICRKEWLTKIARGKFALTEYVASSPELYPSLSEKELTES